MIGLSFAITASALAPRRALASAESLVRIRRNASLLGLVSNLPFGYPRDGEPQKVHALVQVRDLSLTGAVLVANAVTRWRRHR